MNEWQTNTQTHTHKCIKDNVNELIIEMVMRSFDKRIFIHILHTLRPLYPWNATKKQSLNFFFMCLRCLIWSAHGLRFSFVWDSLLISDYTVLPVSVCFITVRRKVNAIKWKIPSDYSNNYNNNNGRNYANWQKKPAEKNIKSNKKRNMQYIFYCHQK